MEISLENISPQIVGKRVDALRAALGMKKGAFATSIQIDPSQYSKAIKGKSATITIKQAYIASELYGVDLNYFFKGKLKVKDEKLREKIKKKLHELDY